MNNELKDIKAVAIRVSDLLGAMVNNDQTPPPDVLIGSIQGTIAFWLGCLNDGARVDGLAVLRQVVNEEIDSMTRGIANGMVPA